MNKPLIGLVFTLVALQAQALPVNIPVPTNALITQAGLDWAWAAPCAPTGSSCGVIDLSFQSAFGWRLPTAAEVLNHPLATDFVLAGANVPLGGSDPNGARFGAGSPGGDAACAAPYFSTRHRHCDWRNGVSNFWAGLPSTRFFYESLVVRRAQAAPEPGTLAMFGLGLAGFGFARRRKGCKILLCPSDSIPTTTLQTQR